jgi:hypothetical protein
MTWWRTCWVWVGGDRLLRAAAAGSPRRHDAGAPGDGWPRAFLPACARRTFLRPDTDRWLARMFDRLTQVGGDDGAIDGGQTLLLAGLLVLALRREDADLGRQVRAIVRAKGLKAVPLKAAGQRCGPHGAPARPNRCFVVADRCERAGILAWPCGRTACGDAFARNRPARRVRQPGLDLFGRGIGHLAHLAASSGQNRHQPFRMESRLV